MEPFKVNHDSPGEKAEIFNESSHRNSEKKMSSMPSQDYSSYPTAPDLNIRVEGVTKILKDFFPRGVLDEILNLIESVSEDFPSYS